MPPLTVRLCPRGWLGATVRASAGGVGLMRRRACALSLPNSERFPAAIYEARRPTCDYVLKEKRTALEWRHSLGTG